MLRTKMLFNSFFHRFKSIYIGAFIVLKHLRRFFIDDMWYMFHFLELERVNGLKILLCSIDNLISFWENVPYDGSLEIKRHERSGMLNRANYNNK